MSLLHEDFAEMLPDSPLSSSASSLCDSDEEHEWKPEATGGTEGVAELVPAVQPRVCSVPLWRMQDGRDPHALTFGEKRHYFEISASPREEETPRVKVTEFLISPRAVPQESGVQQPCVEPSPRDLDERHARASQLSGRRRRRDTADTPLMGAIERHMARMTLQHEEMRAQWVATQEQLAQAQQQLVATHSLMCETLFSHSARLGDKRQRRRASSRVARRKSTKSASRSADLKRYKSAPQCGWAAKELGPDLRRLLAAGAALVGVTAGIACLLIQ